MIEKYAFKRSRRYVIEYIEGLNSDFLLEASKGELIGKFCNRKFSGISTDSRNIEEGQVFIALRGETFDGHEFVEEAIRKGAGSVIIEEIRDRYSIDQNLFIKVDSTLGALGDISKLWRSQINGLKVIAITGSNGKTTTKEMMASLLSNKYEVLKNSGNFNNLIGLPLTLLNLRPEHEIAVLELGMNEFGEIKRLSEICIPDMGVITNIGKAHIGNLGGLEGVKKAKAELVENFDDSKTFIVNADDARVVEIASKVKCKKFTYGLKNKADLMAENLQRDGLKNIKFDMRINDKRESVKINCIGIHNVFNALCAASAAHVLGMEYRDIVEGLESSKFPIMRLEILHSIRGFKIINDSYNANPNSMKNAIDELLELKGTSRAIAVLGDMLELGEDSVREHREIGEYLSNKDVDYLFTYGDLGQVIYDFAKESVRGKHVTNYQSIADEILRVADDGDLVLIKGSRGMKMEKIINFLEVS